MSDALLTATKNINQLIEEYIKQRSKLIEIDKLYLPTNSTSRNEWHLILTEENICSVRFATINKQLYHEFILTDFGRNLFENCANNGFRFIHSKRKMIGNKIVTKCRCGEYKTFDASSCRKCWKKRKHGTKVKK